jgi:hypothetical protein
MHLLRPKHGIGFIEGSMKRIGSFSSFFLSCLQSWAFKWKNIINCSSSLCELKLATLHFLPASSSISLTKPAPVFNQSFITSYDFLFQSSSELFQLDKKSPCMMSAKVSSLQNLMTNFARQIISKHCEKSYTR